MHLYIIAYYHHNIEECVSHAIRSYNGPVWIPLLAFEAVLALLAIWVGIKHSRQGPRSKSSRFSKPQLADSLIHGNVIYFVRWEFTCHCWKGSDYKAQSTRHICSTSQWKPADSIGGTGYLLGCANHHIRWLSPYSFNPRGGLFSVFNLSLPSDNEYTCRSFTLCSWAHQRRLRSLWP